MQIWPPILVRDFSAPCEKLAIIGTTGKEADLIARWGIWPAKTDGDNEEILLDFL